jgi:2-methylisocitrate lyase-like PEP mutase family enzyme
MSQHPGPAARLRALLARDAFLSMPCCFDALSARLIERAGFPLTFMSGFAVSAARLALPDTGLITASEMVDQGRAICQAVSIPVIGDGDTGHGNPANVHRTVEQYALSGFAGVMIEDQVAPKRCGHTGVKEVVSREEALRRIRAAVDARDSVDPDLAILARTDARGTLGLDEAIWRMKAFADLGADILFLEAPLNEREMDRFCREAAGVRMVNMLEGGITPILPPTRLMDLGYRIAAYPVTLLACAVRAMQEALTDLAAGRTPQRCVDFLTLRGIVGFDEYDRLVAAYADQTLLCAEETP